jgi:hypothetical protein
MEAITFIISLKIRYLMKSSRVVHIYASTVEIHVRNTKSRYGLVSTFCIISEVFQITTLPRNG